MSRLFRGLFHPRLVLLLALAAHEASAQTPAAAPPTPPTPPAAPTPVGYFRQLLGASPAERERLLTGKSPQQRRVLTNSIRIYLDLPEAERETRLRTMELRSQLSGLLRLAPAERTVRLKAIPEKYRDILEGRLAFWDQLPTNVQQQILEHDRFGAGTSNAPPLPPIPTVSAVSLPKAALKSVPPWQAVTPARQQEVIAAFTNLFDLAPDLKRKKLDPLPLSPSERALIDSALETFRRLQPAQRQACVDGFKRFAELEPAERIQFLRNAEAWQKMAPADRQRWRDLIHIMPQLPPEPGSVAPPLPPIPQPPAPGYAASNGPAGR